ncbi:MAG: tRNA pseudouridine(38-40) synthase TruA [Planctomycetales bacterium]|nr:tRNA pseudouridine(38-40) synthase TruA [Planctomycetales bacterium]
MYEERDLAGSEGRAFRLTIAYDGTNYFGWQRQPDFPTVQSEIEQALAHVTNDPQVKAYASSRTDTGVHALGQSAVFRTDSWRASADSLPFALNTKLPPDIVVRAAVEVPWDFNPLKESTGKRYRYQVYCSRKADPIQARTHWWVRQRMSLVPMQAAAQLLTGEHDFISFQSAGSPRSSTVRHVRALSVNCSDHMDGRLYTFDIEANGFLYNMVRNIVGTLVQVGVGHAEPAWVSQVLLAGDRRVAGATAPPQGLFLVEVYY